MSFRKIAAILLLMSLMLCTGCAVGQSAERLLTNGGFELLDAKGAPQDWYPTAYRNQVGYSRIAVTDERAHSGQYSAMVENASMNDARYTCTVSVEPESLYKLSGYVLVESMQDSGNGANLAIEGIYANSEPLFDTQGEWKLIEWYGETGISQREVTIDVRVGGYGAESVGKAYFDDLTLEKVDALPDDVIASVWYSTKAASGTQEQSDDGTQKSTLWFLLCALAFVVLFAFGRQLLGRKELKYATLVLAALMIAGLTVRILLACNVAGYQVDMNCFTAWSLRMADKGPAGFYTDGYFCDYPPGYMLLLWPCGALLKAFGAQGALVTRLIVKCVPILCDMLGALLLYAYAKKRAGSVVGLLLAGLYLFNPAVLVNGAAWGQVDSVLALLMLLTALLAMDKCWRAALPMFFVSVLVKPQALLFAPVGGMWLIYTLVKDREQRTKAWRDIAIGLAIGVLTATAVIVPFSLRQEKPVGWIFELYSQTLSSYPRATLNTANLYYLSGANWVELTQRAPLALCACAAVVLLLLGAWLIYRSGLLRDRKLWRGKLSLLGLLSALVGLVVAIMGLLGATYGVLGYTLMVYAFAFAILCMLYDGRAALLPFYMALALIGVYVIGVKVHERYLFPALLLLLASYAGCRDKRLLWLMLGFSVTTFLNTAIVLDNSILFGSSLGHLNNDTLALNIALCIMNLALLGFAGYIAVSGVKESRLQENSPEQSAALALEAKAPPSYERMLLDPKDASMHLRLRDYLIMLAAAVAYGVLAFANLGSTTAPQEGWISTSEDEQIVFELPQSTSFKLLYYAGVSYNSFSVAVSEDGQSWSVDYPCEMREGLCYRWNYASQSTDITQDAQSASKLPDDARRLGDKYYRFASGANAVLTFTGKYLRLNACEAGLNLFEIVVRDMDGNQLPLTVVSHTGAQPQLLDDAKPADHLIDEQDTCIGEPGWYNGTYFDEIYHARTAYEHLHGQVTYEWTHPPLGKLMMSAGIAIFGMTPFGWRFAGALIGVLMLPALYLLTMQLTKKRPLAVFSMLALALDLMHYTQTRIATIDSFPVFFIILTYLCMARYMQTDVFAVAEGEKPRLMSKAFIKSQIPLCLCGVFMGLSIASKWIGLYSAVGLALLFFLTVYRQFRVGLIAFSYDTQDKDAHYTNDQQLRIKTAQDYTLLRIVITCGLCLVFFILIPCLIYYLSYIPQLSPTGRVTIQRIVDVQKRMLSYHSTPGLGMDHPFQSPWWQWPFILKPMWFNQDKFEPDGFASTIMCMGNPWVFYIGAACMAAVLIAFVAKYIKLRNGLALRHGDGDLTLTVLIIGFLAQYLPWILVPRSMYMYHYFASVPFIILATAWIVGLIPQEKKRLTYAVIGIYLAGAAVFFVLYFPYASGWLTNIEWLDSVKGFLKLYY